MSKCFADTNIKIKGSKGVKGCLALTVKNCTDCNFFKTQEQVDKEEEKTRERLSSLKNKSINIFK